MALRELGYKRISSWRNDPKLGFKAKVTEVNPSTSDSSRKMIRKKTRRI